MFLLQRKNHSYENKDTSNSESGNFAQPAYQTGSSATDNEKAPEAPGDDMEEVFKDALADQSGARGHIDEEDTGPVDDDMLELQEAVGMTADGKVEFE